MPRASLIEPMKWAAFRALEKLSDLRGNNARLTPTDLLNTKGGRALWLYASTIGELNAIEPFARALTMRLGHLQMVLITEHAHYRDAYLAKYPKALVYITRGHSDDAHRLAERHPPSLLVIAEIPCLPSDAPCRFAYAFPREARRRGAPVCLVNGWLYNYVPSCTMDAVERRLFERDHVGQFDLACVQNAEIADRLIRAGASPERVMVTGNLKFDAINRQDWTPDTAHSPVMLRELISTGRPVIVAGCVTDHEEMARVFQAFALLRQSHPEALLVHAPRHPEYPENIREIEQLTDRHALSTLFRSRLGDTPIPYESACLVLDTMGELKDFYAAATIAHVGVDHNILEPMAFDKPVTVSPGWEATYPSYPVYQILIKSRGILESATAETLATTWLNLIENQDGYIASKAITRQALREASGALEKTMRMFEPLIGELK